MSDSIILALSEQQRECFLNFLDDYPLVIRTLQGGEWSADVICERAMVLKWEMEEFSIPATLSDLDRAILKASVEHNDWLKPYEGQSEASKNRRPVQLRVLRECAARLETVGVEVDHLPA